MKTFQRWQLRLAWVQHERRPEPLGSREDRVEASLVKRAAPWHRRSDERTNGPAFGDRPLEFSNRGVRRLQRQRSKRPEALAATAPLGECVVDSFGDLDRLVSRL